MIFPLSQSLLKAILSDRVSDHFVCKLIWERLDYQSTYDNSDLYIAGSLTPNYWSEKFPFSPQVIAKRNASVHLTRSIPKEYKQSLKEHLDFKGYRIGELFPRRTRRATAVNWLLAWQLSRYEELPLDGPLPKLLDVPADPLLGHPGDLVVE